VRVPRLHANPTVAFHCDTVRGRMVQRDSTQPESTSQRPVSVVLRDDRRENAGWGRIIAGFSKKNEASRRSAGHPGRRERERERERERGGGDRNGVRGV
jgi:hypothetical protein